MSNGAKRFFKLFAKNIKESLGAGHYQSVGISITCMHCQYDKFEHGHAQLNTALLSFLNLDFANRTANTLTCHRCGFVHWFNKDVKRVQISDKR
ncbi:zinc ribbon domain-containing protein [Bacillaceae bacterium IKA-2]|nr:zinc ribbon domain-containing protein [Bacillaceae bacterium IKA-2]